MQHSGAASNAEAAALQRYAASGATARSLLTVLRCRLAVAAPAAVSPVLHHRSSLPAILLLLLLLLFQLLCFMLRTLVPAASLAVCEVPEDALSLVLHHARLAALQQAHSSYTAEACNTLSA